MTNLLHKVHKRGRSEDYSTSRNTTKGGGEVRKKNEDQMIKSALRIRDELIPKRDELNKQGEESMTNKKGRSP